MIDLPRLRAIAARAVIVSMPTLAGCSTFGTFVLPIEHGTRCEDACQTLVTDGPGHHVVGVNACTYGSYRAQAQLAEGTEGQEVAICRVVMTGGPAGRRPAGLRPAQPSCTDEIGGWFARAARLEAASVPAFTHLARELHAHRAPRDLVEDAGRAADDERRHAWIMSAWRDRLGAPALEVHVDPTPIRSLEEIAIENAVEGCAGELWGGMLALHQSFAARDPALRRDMARIADDELGHAHLSMRVHAWARGRLAPGVHARAHEAGLRALDASIASPRPGEATREALGLPDAATGHAMAHAARRSGLFSATARA